MGSPGVAWVEGNAAMAIPNLIRLLTLSSMVARETRDYLGRRGRGGFIALIAAEWRRHLRRLSITLRARLPGMTQNEPCTGSPRRTHSTAYSP